MPTFQTSLMSKKTGLPTLSTQQLQENSSKTKSNLLNKAAKKAFFAQPLEDVAPSPPKQPKLDDSGLSDARGSLFAESGTQTDLASEEHFLKLCKVYFQNQGKEVL